MSTQEKVPGKKPLSRQEKSPLGGCKRSKKGDFGEWPMEYRTATALIISLYFFCGIVYSLPSAFYSPFLVDEQKHSVTEAAFVLASFDVSNVAVSLLYPYFMLRFDSKNLFNFGALIMWVTNGLFGCAMQITMDLTMMVVFSILIRFLMGVGAALLCCSGTDLVGCTAGKKHAVGFIAWALSATWLGDMLGPLIGGLLEGATSSYLAPFLIISGFIILCQCELFYTVRNELFHNKLDVVLISFSTWYTFLFQFEIIMAVAATFIIALGMGAVEVDLALYLHEEFKMGPATIALIFGLMPMMFALVTPVVSFLNNPPYPLIMLAFSVLFFCPGFGFLASGIYFRMESENTKLAIFLVCVCLIGVGVALGESPFYPFVLDIALHKGGFNDNSELTLQIAAVNNTTYAVGRIFGTVLLGGLLTQYLNFEVTNLVVCSLYLIVYTVFLVMYIWMYKGGYKQCGGKGKSEATPLKEPERISRNHVSPKSDKNKEQGRNEDGDVFLKSENVSKFSKEVEMEADKKISDAVSEETECNKDASSS